MTKHIEPKARSVLEIVAVVERALDLPEGSICDPERRTYEVSLGRHVAFYIARHETKLSFATIGKTCGMFDHTTVTHGFNRIAIGLSSKTPDIVRAVRVAAPGVLS